MSNRPNYYKSNTEAPVNDNKGKKQHSLSRKIVTVAIVVLIILLMFWLFVAEDIGAWSGWGNP